jgi:hypothetical protein
VGITASATQPIAKYGMVAILLDAGRRRAKRPAIPAMATKIIEWSARRSHIRAAGGQYRRWSSALIPNKPDSAAA